jgi:hypothetical protein
MTTPPGAMPPRRGRRLPVSGPTVLSSAATLISVVALVVAVAAFDREPESSTQALQPAGTTSSPTATPAADPTTDGPTPEPTEELVDPGGEPTGDAPLPSGGAPYTVFKEDVRITLAGGYNASRGVDLDQPLVNADSPQADVRFSTTIDAPKLRFDSVNVAEGRSKDVTPDECASDIQLSPTDEEVKLSQDLVICTVTNGIGAVNEPSRPKMARIVVNTVNDDGTTTLTITTWEIPR